MVTAVALTLFAASAPNVAAQMPDTLDKTFMTFSNTVELPGLQLPAGTYIFRLADTPSRGVVQVLSQDGKEMLGQWLFIPAERQEATGDTVVTFRETAAGTMPAVQYWFYPGERTGKEFIYPKDQATQIAQRTGATVMTEEGPVGTNAQASARSDAQIAPAQEQGAVAVQSQTQNQPVGTAGRQDRNPPSGVTSSQQEGMPATRGQTTMSGDQQTGQTARAELPQTASPLAFAGLLGLLMLAGAAGLRAFRS
ncbi:MAG: hypothetical protein A3F70_02715 [Acidobacteria bacterium RIFCSPLOWO2_12_FULL_67_14]|nr:MAG: hypothetical protein A3H29_19360 [Acidobacteria bacterium RIFCSPLOWO2_02_FULL_67_21]OFW37086.1 MAG: hypothetical protein A3F70_02715 [Acidobacteria bacterium RIFCSPLOWO2_12_FULL_67_14]